MLLDRFPNHPDHARLWVYTAADPLTPAHQAALQAALQPFFDQWASHGRAVQGALTFHADRFLLVAASVEKGDVSGCGIDASVHAVETAAAAQGLAFAPALQIAYRAADGTVQVVSRPTFRSVVRSGTVTTETPVFDLSLATVGALRTQGFERPAGASWHARLFRIPQPV